MPVQGALFDQPLELIVRMEAAQNVYRAYDSYQNRSGSAQERAEKHPGLERVYLSVEEIRDEDG